MFICVSLQAEEEVGAYLERLEESISSTEGMLHRTTAPNLKALEKMREVKAKLEGVTEGILLVSVSVKIHTTNSRLDVL